MPDRLPHAARRRSSGARRRATRDASPRPAAGRWDRFSTLGWALAGAALLWAALPPLNWWPLGWIAPACWVVLIRRPQLAGRRPYGAVYAAGVVHWLLVMEGIRRAHWALYFGWAALALYLGVYLVLFVALTRTAVHRMRWPVTLAAPVVWTGLELARGHMMTGFSMALLGHTQANQTAVIQIADLFGGYGVSFLLMWTAAAAAEGAGRLAGTARGGWAAAFRPLLPAAAAVAAAVAYGAYRLHEPPPPAAASAPPLRVALIQHAIDTVLDGDPRRAREAFAKYRELTLRACRGRPDLDLVVWPESMFTAGTRELLAPPHAQPPPGMQIDPQQLRRRMAAWQEAFQLRCARLAAEANRAAGPGAQIRLIVGAETEVYDPNGSRYYNSALLISPAGRVLARYFKIHLVMFGEYVPFGRRFPWLYRLTPLTAGLTPGNQFVVFPVGKRNAAPSICFESTVPHLIRRQVVELTASGRAPDLLVNVTNDGWFWGSAVLDHHFACAVFRAVELRRPVLVAANTGLSASIDGCGRVRRKGPRRAAAVLLDRVRPDGRTSLYLRWGDGPAAACLAACCLAALAGVWPRRRDASAPPRRPAAAG